MANVYGGVLVNGYGGSGTITTALLSSGTIDNRDRIGKLIYISGDYQRWGNSNNGIFEVGDSVGLGTLQVGKFDETNVFVAAVSVNNTGAVDNYGSIGTANVNGGQLWNKAHIETLNVNGNWAWNSNNARIVSMNLYSGGLSNHGNALIETANINGGDLRNVDNARVGIANVYGGTLNNGCDANFPGLPNACSF